MARSFSLRDVVLVYRLGNQGTHLHAETALTKSWQPLWVAFYSVIDKDTLTVVWRANTGKGAGFVQLHIDEDKTHAQIVYLACNPNPLILTENGDNGAPADDSSWLALLDATVAKAGQKGVHSLVAEVNELGDELPILRRAGFAVFTRQDVWTLTGRLRENNEQTILQLFTPTDEWDVAWLYAHVVPPLIQSVEPNPPDDGVTWVLREGDELLAFVVAGNGPAGTWLQFFIHPNVHDQAVDIISAAINKHAPRPDHPVYCVVRRYESWLQFPLETLGFTHWGSQAVMVKHTVHPIRKQKPVLSTLLQQQGVTTRPTTMSQRLETRD